MTFIGPTDSLTDMPDMFHAGTTVKYTRSDDRYPANDGWALTLYFAGVSVLTPIAGVASGTNFTVTIPAVKTKELLPGDYQWRELASKAGDSYVVAAGTVTVVQNLAAAGAGDAEPLDVILLRLVEQRLTGRLTEDMERYQIGGRTIDRIPVKDLFRYRDVLTARIRALRHPGEFGVDVVVTPRDE